MRKLPATAAAVRKALLLASGVRQSGYGEVIALDVGEAETETALAQLPERPGEPRPDRHPVRRLRADTGLKKAIRQVLGWPWQRCGVHFLREALGHARREQRPMLVALLRPIFNANSGALSSRRPCR